MTLETGQLLRLQIPVRGRALWLAPAWAVLCGVVASGDFVWTWRNGLIAALALILADGAWATLWWGLVELGWPQLRASWNTIDVEPALLTLPFAQPGSPAHRSQRWLTHFKAWWTAGGNAQAGSPLSSAVFALVLGVLLSAVIGWEALALTLAAFALTQMGLIRSWNGHTAHLARGLLDVGLAWILGQVAFGSLTVLSAFMAFAFSLACAGSLDLVRGGATARRWLLAQVLIAIVLVLIQQPFAALACIAVVIAQALLATALQGLAFARTAQFWLMLAMLIAALGVR